MRRGEEPDHDNGGCFRETTRLPEQPWSLLGRCLSMQTCPYAVQCARTAACVVSCLLSFCFSFLSYPPFFLIHVTTPQTYTRTHTGKYHLAVCKAVACKEPSHITSLPIARTLRKPLRASVFFTPLVFIIIVISSAVSAYSSFFSSSSRAVHRHRKPTAAFVPITTSSSCCCCRCCSSVVERFRMPRK